MSKLLLKMLINIRLAYFHAHPGYIKFFMGGGSDEAHFQKASDGSIHSNLVFKDEKK